MFWIVEHITEARKELVDCESNKMYHGIELHRKPLSLIHREFYLLDYPFDAIHLHSVYFYIRLYDLMYLRRSEYKL